MAVGNYRPVLAYIVDAFFVEPDAFERDGKAKGK
jgi:hypothetical protein